MQRSDFSRDFSVDLTVDRVLIFILSIIVLALIYPYFVWGAPIQIARVSHLVGNLLFLVIIIKYYKFKIYNIEIVIIFILFSLHSMFLSTEINQYTYIPLLTVLFLALHPNEQLRIFDVFVSIMAIIYFVGLISYLLGIAGLNIQISEAIAPNPGKGVYLVYLGHAQESGLPMYRFSSIFDEAGVVGTTSGLILSSIGVSWKDKRSIVILLAGLISFSLAFYVILLINLIFVLDVKKAVNVLVLFIALYFVAGDRIYFLIGNRLTVKDGQLAGDNRTQKEFEAFYDAFLDKGGSDLVFGKGIGYANSRKESDAVSSYKLIIMDFGLLGAALILAFYTVAVLTNIRSIKGWLLCFIFLISAYQRPDLTSFTIVVMYLGGLRYLERELIPLQLDEGTEVFNEVE